MKRTLIFILPFAMMACSDGNDPVADAQKVCDCFDTILDNPDSEVDCSKLISDMGERYKYNDVEQATYAQAYNDCRN